jgi:hypothetical protein
VRPKVAKRQNIFQVLLKKPKRKSAGDSGKKSWSIFIAFPRGRGRESGESERFHLWNFSENLIKKVLSVILRYNCLSQVKEGEGKLYEILKLGTTLVGRIDTFTSIVIIHKRCLIYSKVFHFNSAERMKGERERKTILRWFWGNEKPLNWQKNHEGETLLWIDTCF